MTDKEHEALQALLAAAALSALSEPEEVQVIQHVIECDGCREELEEFQSTVAWLDAGAGPVPADLADRVLAAASRKDPPASTP